MNWGYKYGTVTNSLAICNDSDCTFSNILFLGLKLVYSLITKLYNEISNEMEEIK
jgi:hypothetical protein